MVAGESLVLPPLHRHWIVLVGLVWIPVIAGTVLLVLVDWVAAAFVSSDVRVVFTLVLLAAAGLWAIVGWLQWQAYSLTVTDQRVILEQGIFFKQSKVIPLDRVQDVETTQTVLGRLLDYGTVDIHVAGGRETYPNARSPEILRDQVFVLSEQLRRGL